MCSDWVGHDEVTPYLVDLWPLASFLEQVRFCQLGPTNSPVDVRSHLSQLNTRCACAWLSQRYSALTHGTQKTKTLETRNTWNKAWSDGPYHHSLVHCTKKKFKLGLDMDVNARLHCLFCLLLSLIREVLLYVGIDWITLENAHTLRALSHTKYPYREYVWALFHTEASPYEAATNSTESFVSRQKKKVQLSGELDQKRKLVVALLDFSFRHLSPSQLE